MTFSAAGYPLFGTLIVLGPQIISVLYGPKWTATIVPFQILCLAGPARIFTVLGSSVLGATAEVGAEARRRSRRFCFCVAVSWRAGGVSAPSPGRCGRNLVYGAELQSCGEIDREGRDSGRRNLPLMATAMMMAVGPESGTGCCTPFVACGRRPGGNVGRRRSHLSVAAVPMRAGPRRAVQGVEGRSSTSSSVSEARAK